MSITDTLRDRVRDYMGKCECCGQQKRSYREAGAELGVTASSLHRFLAGKGLDSTTLDKLYERFMEPQP